MTQVSESPMFLSCTTTIMSNFLDTPVKKPAWCGVNSLAFSLSHVMVLEPLRNELRTLQAQSFLYFASSRFAKDHVLKAWIPAQGLTKSD